MKWLVWVVLIGLITPLWASNETGPLIHFPVHGFSISPLEGINDNRGVLLVMSLPASDNFTPNVNVVSEPWRGTMDDYIKVSRRELAKISSQNIKITPINDKTVEFEYVGPLKGKMLHFYSKAIRGDKDVLLVTGTATENQWREVSQQLKQCVDSFRRD